MDKNWWFWAGENKIKEFEKFDDCWRSRTLWNIWNQTIFVANSVTNLQLPQTWLSPASKTRLYQLQIALLIRDNSLLRKIVLFLKTRYLSSGISKAIKCLFASNYDDVKRVNQFIFSNELYPNTSAKLHYLPLRNRF